MTGLILLIVWVALSGSCRLIRRAGRALAPPRGQPILVLRSHVWFNGYMVDKEVGKLIRYIKQQAWRVEDSGRHYHAFPPDPNQPMVVIPRTPSDHRSMRNAISVLRRAGLVWPPR